MPNPKTGTVTFDVAKAIRETKAGKVEFSRGQGGHRSLPDRPKFNLTARSSPKTAMR